MLRYMTPIVIMKQFIHLEFDTLHGLVHKESLQLRVSEFFFIAFGNWLMVIERYHKIRKG